MSPHAADLTARIRMGRDDSGQRKATWHQPVLANFHARRTFARTASIVIAGDSVFRPTADLPSR